jgi:predicted nucleotide-binding protein
MPEDKLQTLLGRNKRLFISYAQEDHAFARELGRAIADRGASVFLDIDMSSGSFWADSLRSEIERATALILIIPSRHVANRNNILFEAGAAKALGKPVLAVLPPKHQAERIELPTDIAGVLVLDADRRSVENIADTLLQATPVENPEPAAA